ncbi:MAG: beta-galactosidase trimerization domain-containing protein [Planctomycetia bacterium]
MAGCRNAPETVQQIIGRLEAQMIYLALLHGQHRVDLVTEDDIAVDGILSKYDVLHVAGEWIDHRVPAKLEAWVRAGGILYASGGLGILNEFNEPDPAMQKVLGLSAVETSKNLAVIRPVMELPVAPPIGEITFDGSRIPAVGLKQVLTPADAKVLGTWADGKPAVTVRELGTGKVFAVGTLAGCCYLRTGLPVQPFARGGNLCPVTPTTFDPAAGRLARLGVDAKPIEEPAVCDNPYVEAIVMDGPAGSVLTLANWTSEPVRNLKVRVRLAARPKEVRSVQAGRAVPAEFKDGVLTLTTDLEWADHVLLPK